MKYHVFCWDLFHGKEHEEARFSRKEDAEKWLAELQDRAGDDYWTFYMVDETE